MNTIKWNEKCFEETGLYIWIYKNGALVCTNNRHRKRINLKDFRIYTHKKTVRSRDNTAGSAKGSN